MANIQKTAPKPTFGERLVQLWEKFNLFSAIKQGESLPVMIGKIIVRIIGLILMILLSPFLFIGLGIAFLLAG